MSKQLLTVLVALVHPNPANYREAVDQDHLNELIESIRHYGVLTPLAVRPYRERDGRQEYVCIAGNTRLLASQMAGLTEIPVCVHLGDLSEVDELALAMTENLVRRNPAPLSTGRGFQRMIALSGKTAAEVAKDYGFSPSQVCKYLALLKLEPEIQEKLANGSISMRAAYDQARKPRAKPKTRRYVFRVGDVAFVITPQEGKATPEVVLAALRALERQVEELKKQGKKLGE